MRIRSQEVVLLSPARPHGNELTTGLAGEVGLPDVGVRSAAVGEADYRAWLAALDSADALSLYLHIPFCESGCHYCSRNKIVTVNRERLYVANRLMG